MKNKKKLSISAIKVKSFITTFNPTLASIVKAGGASADGICTENGPGCAHQSY